MTFGAAPSPASAEGCPWPAGRAKTLASSSPPPAGAEGRVRCVGVQPPATGAPASRKCPRSLLSRRPDHAQRPRTGGGSPPRDRARARVALPSSDLPPADYRRVIGCDRAPPGRPGECSAVRPAALAQSEVHGL